MIGQIERYIKQAIFDKNAMYGAAMHFCKGVGIEFCWMLSIFLFHLYILLESTGTLRDRAPLVQRNYCRHWLPSRGGAVSCLVRARVRVTAEQARRHGLSGWVRVRVWVTAEQARQDGVSGWVDGLLTHSLTHSLAPTLILTHTLAHTPPLSFGTVDDRRAGSPPRTPASYSHYSTGDNSSRLGSWSGSGTTRAG